MAVAIDIKVVPQSGKQAISIDKNGSIKCHIKSPPEQGKANAELIKFLAKSLKVPQNTISIIQGATTRNKTIKFITFDTKETVLALLGLGVQTSLTL